MNLDMDDLKHCHKVLASDIEECQMLFGSDNVIEGRHARIQKRIEQDKLVMDRIERILGYKPEYAFKLSNEHNELH